MIPVSRVKRFSRWATSSEQIDVFQGEHSLCPDNTKLGEYLIRGLKPMPAGEQSIDVRFTYDLNGILEVDMNIVSTARPRRW